MTTIQVGSLGNIGNRMIQYMAALKLQSLVPNAQIRGIDLPEWGIRADRVPLSSNGLTLSGPRVMRIEMAEIAERLTSGDIDQVNINIYAQHIDNFMSPESYQQTFPFVGPEADDEVIRDDELLINIRSNEILRGGVPWYVVLPPEFYARLLDETSLRPVFMGQISGNRYTDRLREAFPTARFLNSRGVLSDFQIIRSAKNVVVSVSTFSWLAAWLGQAARVIVPVAGFYSWVHFPEIDFLTAASRFEYYLFPFYEAQPPEKLFASLSSTIGLWRKMPFDSLQLLRIATPRFVPASGSVEAFFDEQYYLDTYPDVTRAVSEGVFSSGAAHYKSHGERERRFPFALDSFHYQTSYPLAALEVGQGDYRNFHEHFAGVGSSRGYRPF